MLVTPRPSATLALLTFLIVPGCSTPQCAPTSPDATQLQGLWDMDLSPAQDRSYLKDLVIVPVATGGASPALAFTGTVYGGSPFDNGLVTSGGERTIFAFVSDEAGQQGGPYYWLGSQTSPTTLAGRVQSLARSFQLNWSARRKER